jgi:hemerythrin-like domain-containing protein
MGDAMFQNRVCQKLYEEHTAVQALLQRVEQAIARHRDDAPDAKDPLLSKLMSDLVSGLPGEVNRHFDFEEAELFSFLADQGNVGIGNHLTYEHGIIRPIGAALVNLIKEARAKGFDPERWADFRKLGQQLAMTLGPHAHKEDMALLPMLEDAMDEAKEAELYEKYVLEHV